MGYIVAADTGGTFTDLVAYDRTSGKVVYTKSLTTYDNLVDGVLNCIRKAGLDLAEAELIKFGTTLVINTFVQRNGARAVLVTTGGFRDALEIRRGNRPLPFDLRYSRDPVLIERDRRFEVGERIAADGSVIRPLDRSELAALAAVFRKLDVEAVAVSLVNSYANADHEEEAAEFLRAELPGVYVTRGTELSREWYEFERTSTAVANAYVGPKLKDYVSQLDATLAREGFRNSFFLMASNGGVFSLQRAQQQPVMLVESGPVGGCIGAGTYANELGLDKIIAFDMGGTTAKCAILDGGRFEVRSPYYVGGVERGFPVRGGVLDIIEVGTGGGSIASLDSVGQLSVGPRSAGSTPGPACYGKGGVEPTVTDANLVLGRISPGRFLGGEMQLDVDAAEAAIGALAVRLGFSGREGLDKMAEGILALATASMASAIKQITIERGLDPRGFPLVAFGGGGPLHSATLARELNIAEVLIPAEPGNFSALGMILADARVDETQTFLRPHTEPSIAEMKERFQAMEAHTSGELAQELGQARLAFERHAEMRFRGQRHTVKVPVDEVNSVEDVRDRFESTYRQRYGHVERGGELEFVGLVLTTTAQIDGATPRDFIPEVSESGGKPQHRNVYFSERARRLQTPVFQRRSLPIGFTTQGPAVIEEYGSTTIVGPDDSFTIGELGEIRIRMGSLGSAP